MKIRAAGRSDLSTIEALLQGEKLPVRGVPEHLATFLVGENDGRVVAVGGLEVHATVALLRSVAVEPAVRGRGLGLELCKALLSLARSQGVREVYLLTMSAGRFFEKLGFSTVPRDAAPREIRATEEFSEICPASAALMRLEIGAPS
jgi:N-acetylglutamate synthase-like GNAT family acetyltransferase